MSFFSKYKGAISLSFIFLAIILVGWFGIRPLLQLVSGKRDEIQQGITIRENRQRQIGRLEEYREQAEYIASKKDLFKVFLREENMVEYIKSLEEIAREENVKIMIQSKESGVVKKVVPGKPKKTEDDGVGEAPAAGKAEKKDVTILGNLPHDTYVRLGVTVRGQYFGVVRFLHRAETLPVASDVIGMDVIKKEKELTEEEKEKLEGDREPFAVVQVVDQGGAPKVNEKGEKEVPLETELSIDLVVYIEKE